MSGLYYPMVWLSISSFMKSLMPSSSADIFRVSLGLKNNVFNFLHLGGRTRKSQLLDIAFNIIYTPFGYIEIGTFIVKCKYNPLKHPAVP